MTTRRSGRHGVTAALLTAAQLGQAQWFFGNLYEALAHIPDRLAVEVDSSIRSERPSLSTVLRPGSPARYWLPVAPVVVATSVGALIAGWDNPRERAWLGASAASTVSGALVTAYAVRGINHELLFAAQPLPPTNRQKLLRRWHRLNKLRLALSGIAWLTAQKAMPGSH
ncbi:anthrone oxygenase family protein [Bounagaea algeriensis]